MVMDCKAQIAQLVEHILGKDEVTSSILVLGCINVAEESESDGEGKV
jgi:hypothetical protein